MANSNRRYVDNTGKMFVPMNLEGGTWEENFLTTNKLVWIVLSVAAGIGLIFWLNSQFAPIKSYIIVMTIYLIILQFVLRYIVFEEKFYYRMYQEMKKFEISTPSVFWNIASVKDTPDGALLNFVDARVGVIIRLERDTITGKEESFREVHFDSVSDFYKEVMSKKYSFVQMNMMEPAGNDPRLAELDKLTDSSDNPSINRLMELQVGYIKNMTHKTLYETEYVMIYTKDVSKYDLIINDAIDCVSKIQEGAYIGYTILSSRDIIELVKETYGVKYFDYVEATLEMFRKNGVIIDKPFSIVGMNLNSKEYMDVGPTELNKIRKLASDVDNGTIDISNVSIKDTIFVKVNKRENSVGVDFNSLSDAQTAEKSIRITTRKSKQTKEKGGIAEELNLSVEDFNTRTEMFIESDDDEKIDF